MTETTPGIGGCLCGAVRIAARVASPSIQACHCGQCQKWTGGGPLLSVKVADAHVTGQDHVATYRVSAWGERAFCKTCGSTLWWKMQGEPITYIAAGLLDDQSGLHIGQEIFVDHRPGWLAPWPQASQSTEAEEMAALHAYLEGQAT